jgi:hypothetical protein
MLSNLIFFFRTHNIISHININMLFSHPTSYYRTRRLIFAFIVFIIALIIVLVIKFKKHRENFELNKNIQF